MPPGVEVAGAYLAHLLERCARWAGRIFVAETGGELAGFVCVWGRVPPEEPDEAPVAYAYVSDLVVCERHRRRGIGRALMARAEEYAREQGAPRIGIGVLARNDGARGLYRSLGFREWQVQLRKPLA